VKTQDLRGYRPTTFGGLRVLYGIAYRLGPPVGLQREVRESLAKAWQIGLDIIQPVVVSLKAWRERYAKLMAGGPPSRTKDSTVTGGRSKSPLAG
jgi:hypothetical protein